MIDIVTSLLTAVGAAIAAFMAKSAVDKLIHGLPTKLRKPQIEIDVPNGQKIILKRSEVTPEKVEEITRSVAMHG
jgi:hypothetical protein